MRYRLRFDAHVLDAGRCGRHDLGPFRPVDEGGSDGADRGTVAALHFAPAEVLKLALAYQRPGRVGSTGRNGRDNRGEPGAGAMNPRHESA